MAQLVDQLVRTGGEPKGCGIEPPLQALLLLVEYIWSEFFTSEEEFSPLQRFLVVKGQLVECYIVVYFKLESMLI